MKFTSNIDGLRFAKQVGRFSKKYDWKNKIRVFPSWKFQSIIGFGGAFTDATGVNIMSLDEDVRNNLMM